MCDHFGGRCTLIRSRFRPQNYKELFNYRHAHLRNHVERIFGLFKRRFRVLMLAPEYSLDQQARLIPALAVLHNFIQIHDPGDLPEDDHDLPPAHDNAGEVPYHNAMQNARDIRDAASRFRDGMAHHMWRDYQEGNQRQL